MFTSSVHRYIFLFGMFALAFGMMVGTVPTSVPLIILACNWVAEGRFSEKWELLRRNFLFWALSAVYIAHVSGVFYSTDIDAALHDIRTKMPLMFLPLLLLSTKPLKDKEMKWLFYFFIAGCVANTAWCLIYSFVLRHNQEIRSASRFMSHIRLGLYLNMAIAVCFYYGWKEKKTQIKVLLMAIPFYLLFSMAALGLAGGLAQFVFLAIFGGLFVILRQHLWMRLAAAGAVILLLFVSLRYLQAIKQAQLSPVHAMVNIPQTVSAGGNRYTHLDTAGQRENGYYVLMNIQTAELRRSWNREFPDDSFSYDPGHNLHRFEVLVRYMSSKGLLKDSVGYASLTSEDKKNIDNDFTNHLQSDWSFLRRRTYELVNEYDDFIHGRSVNGHSFTMRLYFWKAALRTIGRQPLFGCGTGDVQAEMDLSYQEGGSPLLERWRLRPHNQFLTITVALGMAGLLIFIFSLVAPVVRLRKWLSLLYWPFIVLALLSFVFEDTLETQAGLTFFAFFNAVLLCQAWFRKRGIPEDQPVSR